MWVLWCHRPLLYNSLALIHTAYTANGKRSGFRRTRKKSRRKLLHKDKRKITAKTKACLSPSAHILCKTLWLWQSDYIIIYSRRRRLFSAAAALRRLMKSTSIIKRTANCYVEATETTFNYACLSIEREKKYICIQRRIFRLNVIVHQTHQFCWLWKSVLSKSSATSYFCPSWTVVASKLKWQPSTQTTWMFLLLFFSLRFVVPNSSTKIWIF